MPSSSEWLSALITPRTLVVDSTSATASQVAARKGAPSFKGKPKTVVGLPTFDPPLTIQVTPFEILKSLGRITTPRVRNIVDLSTTWALIRYIWAFNPSTNPKDLRLSSHSMNLDFHQKAVLSDDMGVGFAALIVKRYLKGRKPVPASLALKGVLSGIVSQRYQTSPDYIFERSAGDFIVVECKGTMSGKSNSLKQLKRGTEQVPSLVFRTKKSPLGIVVGTDLSDVEVLVRIVDPPSDKSDEESERTFVVENEAKFERNVDALQRASLLWYVGDFQGASQVLRRAEIESNPEEEERRHPPLERHVFEEIGDEFIGATGSFVYRTDNTFIQVFQGLQKDIYEGLNELTRENLQDLVHSFWNRAFRRNQDRLSMDTDSKTISDSITVSNQRQSTASATLLSDDGTIMQIVVSEQ